MSFWGALFTLALSVPVLAQDYTNSDGRLSDDDFYRAVSCKAAPHQPCAKAMHRWPVGVRDGISVSLVQARGVNITRAYHAEARLAMLAAIAQVNAVGAGVRLVPYTGSVRSLANIRISLVKPKGTARRVTGFRVGSKALKVQNAMSLSRTVGSKIIAARVAIAVDRVAQDKLRSIILEELVQSLGLTWDINNPYYQTRSIFGQVGDDTVTRLRGQDAMALRRHYPN